MDEMRKKGTGTWDHTQERWELKKHKIYMKPKAREVLFGVK
jgi:hypothetical protein